MPAFQFAALAVTLTCHLGLTGVAQFAAYATLKWRASRCSATRCLVPISQCSAAADVDGGLRAAASFSVPIAGIGHGRVQSCPAGHIRPKRPQQKLDASSFPT